MAMLDSSTLYFAKSVSGVGGRVGDGGNYRTSYLLHPGEEESLLRIVSCTGPFALVLAHRPSRAPCIQPLIICFPL